MIPFEEERLEKMYLSKTCKLRPEDVQEMDRQGGRREMCMVRRAFQRGTRVKSLRKDRSWSVQGPGSQPVWLE